MGLAQVFPELTENAEQNIRHWDLSNHIEANIISEAGITSTEITEIHVPQSATSAIFTNF